MRYEGPIYRPPSEADSLLIQATIGCPHNQCTFCMVYKQGIGYRARPVPDIKEDLRAARAYYGHGVQTIFFPAGNTIAMKTRDLAEICSYARELFPALERITVYGSCQYIARKGAAELRVLAEAGLSRIHVGLESGDDEILRQICKGTHSAEQVEAGLLVMEAGIELSVYVMLGIGGIDRTKIHARETARVINAIGPDFVRLRTFVPKIQTPLLADVEAGRFRMLGPHAVLAETAAIVRQLQVSTFLASDHYTNYVNVAGKLPTEKPRMLETIDQALQQSEDLFRPFFIGQQ